MSPHQLLVSAQCGSCVRLWACWTLGCHLVNNAAGLFGLSSCTVAATQRLAGSAKLTCRVLHCCQCCSRQAAGLLCSTRVGQQSCAAHPVQMHHLPLWPCFLLVSSVACSLCRALCHCTVCVCSRIQHLQRVHMVTACYHPEGSLLQCTVQDG